MERAWVRLGDGSDRARLRELLQLERLCTAQRVRRRLAVHLMALGGVPLLLAALHPAAFGRWRSFTVECWLVVAAAALGLWLAECHYARRLERALEQR